MKKIIISILFAIVYLTSFATTADTIAIHQSYVTKWVTDTITTASGKQSVKYYCIYKGQLVSTTKTVYHNVLLCKKYGAECALILVTTNKGKKRILCN